MRGTKMDFGGRELHIAAEHSPWAGISIVHALRQAAFDKASCLSYWRRMARNRIEMEAGCGMQGAERLEDDGGVKGNEWCGGGKS